MDEYIKREDALDAVLFALVGTGFQSTAIYAIREVPTADVVPKSEVEEWQKLYADSQKKWEKAYEELETKLEQAKTEFAREIFEEIEKAISSMKYNTNTSRKTVKVEELKEQVDWVLHEVVPNRLTELKKKYTGEK